jgi:hypothetical protein
MRHSMHTTIETAKRTTTTNILWLVLDILHKIHFSCELATHKFTNCGAYGSRFVTKWRAGWSLVLHSTKRPGTWTGRWAGGGCKLFSSWHWSSLCIPLPPNPGHGSGRCPSPEHSPPTPPPSPEPKKRWVRTRCTVLSNPVSHGQGLQKK